MSSITQPATPEPQADIAVSGDNVEGKIITGYCDTWSLRAGESITLHASTHRPGPATIDVVRIHCGDPTSAGPGFSEEMVDCPGAGITTDLSTQPLVPGSFGTVNLDGIGTTTDLTLDFWFLATRPQEPQTLISVAGADPLNDLSVEISEDQRLHARMGDAKLTLRDRRIAANRWYHVTVHWELANQYLSGEVTTPRSASPARDLLEQTEASSGLGVQLPQDHIEPEFLVLGGNRLGSDFDGRIAAPAMRCDGSEYWWDLSLAMDTPDIIDASGHGRHGVLHQLPTRAVTGPHWDGSTQRWTDNPSMWDAVHFHKEDLYDAGWFPTTTAHLPHNLASGIYAFRVTEKDGEHVDRVPFFVRPAADAATAEVALLMSSATYLAYANHRMLFEGADFIESRAKLRPEHEYIRQHREVGLSMYEQHRDGSGVMFSSRLRPVLNLRPGADGWNFTPDTDINAFLEHEGVGHDIISDEDLHAEGAAALAPYRVIVTCSHPEYWSTDMLNALEAWQRDGGRLMYLGGNGFYWRVAFSDAWPGAMELRRAEDGVRNWEPGNGENYHAFGGEYGGMWRRLNRAPNEIAGIGFAAQGFGRATSFVINDASRQSRAAWVWDGVVDDDGRIGTSGLGGGAAGQEIDRYDTRLGSPEHAVVLASATGFGPDMVRTKEEFGGSVIYPTPDPLVRADVVFYETPGGGAVFSVGSISWFGALARNGYDNDIAAVTANVLRRFADPTPFEAPVS